MGAYVPVECSARVTHGAKEVRQVLRIIAVMAQGSPGVLPEAWQSYLNLDEARTGAAAALRDTRVLGIAIVEDGNPLRFVEWIDTSHKGVHPVVRLRDSELDESP